MSDPMTATEEAKAMLEGVTLALGINDNLVATSTWIDGNPPEPLGADFLSVIVERFNAFPALIAENEALKARAEAAEAELARLREALTPFDRMAGAMFARNWNRDGVAISFVEPNGQIRLTFDDFLAVRAALKGDTP